MQVDSPENCKPDNNKQVSLLADEIAAYLREHAQAADTLDGIVRWWVMRQRLQEGQRQVAQALDILCAQGVVTTRKLPDGVVLFSSATKSIEHDGDQTPSDGKPNADKQKGS